MSEGSGPMKLPNAHGISPTPTVSTTVLVVVSIIDDELLHYLDGLNNAAGNVRAI